MLRQVHQKLGKDRKKFAGKAVSDIAAGLAELCPDGTVRKLRIEEYGEGDPDEPPNWLQPRWLEKGSEKVVVTCQMVITSFGGEELYNSKEYRPFPETKQARDELKEYMDMVNFLDQEAGKAPRLVGDFYRKVKKRPVRWYLGDPGMYKGFDLAARTMKPGERAIFEVDQPMLAASVEKFYESIGFHSTIAGLPQLQYYIEEERLQILEDEMTEKELDLGSKTQRGIKVEMTLLGHIVFRDLSPTGDGSRLHAVLHPGMPDTPVLRRGDPVLGSFFINRPFDGSLLVQNTCVEWRLGEDEGLYAKQGENNEPLRPDGGAFVPKCVGDAILKVDWVELRYGALVEVRLRYGPELQDVAPQYAKQFDQAKKDARKKGRKGGAMCSILVQVFPPSYRPSDAETQDGGTIIDESIPKARWHRCTTFPNRKPATTMCLQKASLEGLHLLVSIAGYGNRMRSPSPVRGSWFGPGLCFQNVVAGTKLFFRSVQSVAFSLESNKRSGVLCCMRSADVLSRFAPIGGCSKRW
ncbi:REV1 [Symbiodinium sp. KB8]|nr:REV1 [Symbiodinium sp. KB8]